MDTTFSTAAFTTPPALAGETVPLQVQAAQWGEINDLLVRLEAQQTVAEGGADVAEIETATLTPEQRANKLIQVRLGIASSLFAALRAKDAATAAHSYRVAVYCSNWAMRRNMSAAERDALEVAALLHDIGKIGVPDSVLLKPGALWHEEVLVMERHVATGLEILRSCCASSAVLEIVACAGCWYDGTRGDNTRSCEQIPLGSRMLAIANAFDAMTTDQVYRRALARERAVSELFRCAGAQFDPQLVEEFANLNAWDVDKLAQDVAQDWFRALNPEPANDLWNLRLNQPTADGLADEMFRRALPDQLTDAVIFVDNHLRVLEWNRGAERMTGIAGASMRGRRWLPSAVAMRDDRRVMIVDEDCPVAHAIQTGQPWVRRVDIKGRGRRRISVDTHITPVVTADGRVEGATLILHDVSPEISLEARCQSLHELATKDPLTQVANRAEFDRVLASFVVVHLEQQRPCSLMMSDIDHFKRVNDTFGHQAGDEVLKFVARVLRNSCRPGDLVARYGGEEFVLLCTDCDNTAATRRAEEIRRKIAAAPQPALDHQAITISCGVTEIQPGDTPETMLRRADRGLYRAKDEGRNAVVQLGAGLTPGMEFENRANVEPVAGHSSTEGVPAGAMGALKSDAGVSPDPRLLAATNLVAWTPLGVTMQKLQGFAADHHAEALFLTGDRVRLHIQDEPQLLSETPSNGVVQLGIDLRFVEEPAGHETGSRQDAAVTRTRIEIAIRSNEDTGREAECFDLARQLVDSLKAYLVAHEADAHVGALSHPAG